MAAFGSCKGKVLKLDSGLLVVPFASAGSGYQSVIIGHLGIEQTDFIGRTAWIKHDDILGAEVVPLATLTFLAAAYGPTH